MLPAGHGNRQHPVEELVWPCVADATSGNAWRHFVILQFGKGFWSFHACVRYLRAGQVELACHEAIFYKQHS